MPNQATETSVYDAAVAYLEAGWTPTPLRGKIPTQKRWSGIKPTKADCWTWWMEDHHDGVGIVCGRTSGNLVVIDIEGALVADVERMSRVVSAAGDYGVGHHLTAAFNRACALTPSGGRHLYLTVTDTPNVPGNAKLAFKGNGDTAVLLAETRGEGGQVAAPPGGGRVWAGTSGPGVSIRVTQTELDGLLNAFRSIDEDIRHHTPPQPAKPYTPDANRTPSIADAWSDALLAGAITWADVLDPGWTFNGYDDEGRSLWVRPDYGNKTKANASAKGFERYAGGAAPVLVVHSTSVPHLPHGPHQRLTPARVWAHINFNGDMAAANAALENVVTTGEADPRIGDLPTAVTERAAAIAAAKPRANQLQPYVTPEGTEELWGRRDYLSHIQTHARATRTAPDAVLAVVLARVASEIMPHVRIPAIVGGQGSLNLYAGLVAFSSGGKTTASAAADDLHAWTFPTKHLGSGEGLMHMFVHRTRVPLDGENEADAKKYEWRIQQHTVSVFAVVDEVDTLTSLSSRQGATLMPALRTMWGGGGFGFGYADPTKALHVEPHRYRLTVVVGIQPARAAALLDDADGGTPQRFIWAATTDPDAPDERPPLPGPLPWRVPVEATNQHQSSLILDVGPVAWKEIDDAHTARLRGATDAADGHALYSRLKVACILGLLDGRLGANDEDWEIAGLIMARSAHTRAAVEATLAQRRKDEGHGRAEAEAYKQIHVQERVAEQATNRASKAIGRHLHRHHRDGSECPKKCYLSAVGGRYRKEADLDAAVTMAIDHGWVKLHERGNFKNGETVVEALEVGEEKP